MFINKRLESLSEHNINKNIGLILEQEPSLAIEYEALCIRLIAVLNLPPKLENKFIINNILKDAREFNNILSTLYQKTNPARAQQLSKHHHFFHKITTQYPEDQEQPHSPVTCPSSPQKTFVQPISTLEKIRLFISGNNILRLLTARLRRGIRHLETLLKLISHPNAWFYSWYNKFDTNIFGPLMNTMSWLFLLPRMLINIFYLLARTFFPHTYAKHAITLSWKQRFLLEWRDRWYELANDIIWVPASLLTCFVLVGNLSTIGTGLGVALFGWDLCINIFRAQLELSRIQNIINNYENNSTDQRHLEHSEFSDEKAAYIAQLKQHRWFEIKRHSIAILNNTLVLGLTFLAVNLVALPIIIPFGAAIALTSLSIIIYKIMPIINKSKPQANFEAMINQTNDSPNYTPINTPSLNDALNNAFNNSVIDQLSPPVRNIPLTRVDTFPHNFADNLNNHILNFSQINKEQPNAPKLHTTNIPDYPIGVSTSIKLYSGGTQ